MQPSGSLLLGPPPLPERVEKSRPWCTQAAEKGVLPMYTDFGYIGSDGVEYATLDEAIEAGAA